MNCFHCNQEISKNECCTFSLWGSIVVNPLDCPRDKFQLIYFHDKCYNPIRLFVEQYFIDKGY